METRGKKYLYEIVYSALKKEIMEEVFPYDVFLPSEKEISARFDVDRATVRKALDFLVSDGFVEKRAGAGTKVIYRKNHQLPSHDSKMIGFFIVEEEEISKKITQLFYSDLFYQVENQCKKYSASMLYSTVRSEEELASILSQQQFHGIIFASKTKQSYLTRAEESGVRIAQIQSYHNNGLSICYDSAGAGSLAVEYLIGKGHRHMAFITGPDDFQSSRDRLSGILSAFFQHDLTLKKACIFPGNWDFDSGYDCTKKLLETLSPLPTAIYAFNDMMALGAVRAIRDSGLKIPEDISIMSSDNIRDLQTMEQRLTTINVNITSLAEVAVGYFFNYNMNPPYGTKIIVPVELVEGDTVLDRNH
ncbi:GntR family transcriptional regulator [Oscillospiraceae bacterium MB08-C2-2]|nr:GntR family transcriptional regulator [Oscillospiraceae bacterium MB08-C2-2]